MALTTYLSNAARLFAGRPALSYLGQTWTYRELQHQAAKFATAFSKLGPHPRIGLLADKTLPGIAALWGTLLCGGSYVPLNAKDPIERLRKIADGAKLDAIVSSKENADKAAAIAACSIFRLDDEQGPPTVFREVADTDLAYVLHTSGSTGYPKGVAIEHGSATPFINWAATYFSLTENDICLGFSPLFFDLSTFDLFGAAKVGAKCVLVPQHFSAFPQSTLDLIRAESVTTLYLVPSVLQDLLGAVGEQKPFHSVKRVLCAGESISAKLLDLMKVHLSHCDWFNLYGPTETNVCTFYQLDPTRTYLQGVPIGQACPFNQITLDPSESGAAEIVVTGTNVMRGYVSSTPLMPERTYRTGDLARIDGQGQLMLVGRQDHQIKRRGFRIELGDVERAYLEDPQVQDAIAVFGPPDSDEKQLVIWLILNTNEPSERAVVLKRSRLRLPSYMVPDRVEFAETFAKTANGKIDRAALWRRE